MLSRRVRAFLISVSIASSVAAAAYILGLGGSAAAATVSARSLSNLVWIEGTVTAGGRPVAGALVEVQRTRGTALLTVAKTRTAKSGCFSLHVPAIAPGGSHSYRLLFRTSAKARWTSHWISSPKPGHPEKLHCRLSAKPRFFGFPVVTY
jgi:hypothetical protein